MGESLLSVGLDVGTTTTQLIFSRLQVENRAGLFHVPRMTITGREILYRSPVMETPLLTGEQINESALRTLVESEYEKAGIRKEQVDTGAVIITGETSRKENAQAVLRALSGFAGEFVAATAGPHLESVLAAVGAGAVTLSEKESRPVLHMDIGGGTSNLALLAGGKILRTGCLNVGGRLIRQKEGRITYVSPVLKGLCSLSPGAPADAAALSRLADTLSEALEMAAGLRPVTGLMEALSTKEAGDLWLPPEKPPILSFSGGVADCIDTPVAPGKYGDIGPELGAAIRKSRLCQGAYVTGQETIRATVIGAGCHSTRLSGSTVHHRNVALPRKDLPVVVFTEQEQDSPQLGALIERRLSRQDGAAVLAFPGFSGGSYEKISGLAHRILEGVSGELLVCTGTDMAKALGQKLALLRPDAPCLCMDGLSFAEGAYLDIGKPTGPAFPVVIKTLVLQTEITRD